MSDPVERSEEFDKTLEASSVDVPVAIEELARYGKRNRRLIRWTVVGLVADFVLSLVLGWGGLQLNQLTNESARNRQNITAACIAGNEFRKDQKALWDIVISISSSNPTRSPEERAQQVKDTAEFRRMTEDIFRPRDCSTRNLFRSKREHRG